MTLHLKGKVSWFGGPEDTGVSPDEGLAFIYDVEDAPHLFLREQPPGTTGLARRLNPSRRYIACRWDYDTYPKQSLLEHVALVRAPKTGKAFWAYPADWGPHEDTDRVADISPGLMSALGITTDDEVEVTYPYTGDEEEEIGAMPYQRICISSGHGLHIRGAHGILDEVDEARKIVDRVADELRDRGVVVDVFHDNTSTDQNTNLNAIVDHHNGAPPHDMDVSVHLNAYEQVTGPMGTECLYVSQTELAAEISDAIASCGFIDRGAKRRTDLFFLNNTDAPAILIEVCFVDSEADAEIYRDQFEDICRAIADVLGGDVEEETAPPSLGEVRPPRPARPIRPPPPAGRIDMAISGDVVVVINGVVVWPDDE